MDTMIELECTYCGEVFSRKLTEHKRSVRLNRVGEYCSRSCAVAHGNEIQQRPGNKKNLIQNNRISIYMPFKWFLYRAKQREDKKGKTDLTLEYLAELWAEQKGICPFTGWRLNLPEYSSKAAPKSPKNASLDRIDCSKGYLKGNVRYVAMMFNFARNDFADQKVIEFCKAVVKNTN